MRREPTCPRCGGHLQPPGLWSSEWVCDGHGAVAPLQCPVRPSTDVLRAVAQQARVPAWLPWPLPLNWLVTGATYAGDERTGGRAVAVACSGPNPLGGMAEMLVVSEEPGVGLGARYAGLPGLDPGEQLAETAPHAKVTAAGHPTALWWVDAGAERAAFVGEAMACWVWVVLWPHSAGALLLEDLLLADLRQLGHETDVVPCGALSPRLSEAPPPS